MDDYIRSLMQDTAEYLTGKVCWVRFQEPILKGASGVAMKSPKGFFIIDIKPGRDEMQTVITFLHECSHVNDDTLKACHYYRLPPLSDEKTPQEWEAHTEKSEEVRADDYAWTLWQWAFDHIKKHIRRDDPPGRRASLMLTALKFYKVGREQ